MDGDVMGATTTKPGLQKLPGIPAIKLVLAAMICLGVVALPALADTNDQPIEKVSPAVVASNPTPNLAPIESQVVVPVVSSAKPIEKETTLPVASKPSPSPDKGHNANDPNVSGKVMAVRWCATCHGKDGQARSPIFPRLAGQQRDYIVAQLHDLRDRSRSDRAAIVYMWGVARNLTDKQIYELADYFSSQKPMRGQRSNSPLLAMGQKIFEQGIPGGVACNACHGLDGGGMGEIPRIAGQHSEYILNQIIAYQNPNDRALMEVGGNTWAPEMQALHRNPERGGGSMASMVKDLSPAEAEAVAIYVSTMNQ